MRSLLNPTGKGIRVDAGGDGHFGAKRGKRWHKGLDFFCTPGQDIVAPDKGFVTRVSFPYEDDLSWKGIVLQLDWCRIKMFYLDPFVKVGAQVYRGQVIAKAQDITLRYPKLNMSPHIHLEFEDIIPDPEFFMEV